MITLRNVSTSYSSESTIGPVDLDIPACGITALIGPNGAGKSTVLSMIGRLRTVDEGTITVDGHDVATTRSTELAKTLSILRQDNHFVTRLTVRQLVGFGRFPHTRGRITARDQEIITRYIRFLNLEALQNRFLDELSGGQRQRAYVAMVLAQETDYVLLDEPLNNLDIAHSVQMMKQLHQAAHELDRTVVVVLHDINFAARYADHICAMKNGKVAAFGRSAEIMDAKLLSGIFDTRIDVVDGPDGPLAVFR